VWALDSRGSTFYCQRLRWADLQRDAFEIRIQDGLVECAAGAPSG